MCVHIYQEHIMSENPLKKPPMGGKNPGPPGPGPGPGPAGPPGPMTDTQ